MNTARVGLTAASRLLSSLAIVTVGALTAFLPPSQLKAGEGRVGPAPGTRQGNTGTVPASPPALALSAERLAEGNRLELGTVFVGHPTRILVEARNSGGGTLELYWSSSDTAMLGASPAALALAGGERGALELTVTPATEGAFAVTAHLVSNTAQGTIDLRVEGTALAPPSIQVTPSSLTSDLFVGGAEDHPLTISNSGGTALEFSAETRTAGGVCAPAAAWVAGAGANALMRVELPAGAASAVVTGLGGPWGIDIAPGATIAYVTEFDTQTLSRLDANSGAREQMAGFAGLPGGLAISADRTRALVGLIDTGDLVSVDLVLGTTETIATGLAGPWDLALEPGDTTLLATEYFAGNLTRIDLASGAATVIAGGLIGPAGFAVDPSGQIAYVAAADAGELLAVDLTTGGSTTVAAGLGSPTGVALAGNEAYVVDSSADRLLRVQLATGDVTVAASGIGAPFGGGLELVLTECQVGYLAVAPATGSVAPSGSEGLTAHFDAEGQPPGDHEAEIVVRSNDPVQPEIVVPALLRVTSAPDLRVSSPQLEFGSIHLGDSITQTLAILNHGTETLTVSALEVSPADYTVPTLPFTIAAGGGRSVAITFTPHVAGAIPGLLSLTSDDPDAPLVTVDLIGSGLAAADIEVSPPSLSTSLTGGTAGTANLVVSNRGVAPLTFFVWPASVTWVRVTPESGSLAPGEDLLLTVAIDAYGVTSGDYAIEIEIGSNDPDEPLVSVPLAIAIVSAAHLRISGEPVVLESVLGYSSTSASTEHRFPITPNPAGGGSIELVADGAFGQYLQTASLSVEGRPLGGAGFSGQACGPVAATVALSPLDLQLFAADGQVDVLIRNSASVPAHCPVNQHTVRFSYDTPGEVVAFGPIFIGNSASRALTLHNDGGETLVAASITTDSPVFQPSLATLSLPPRQRAGLTLTFSPLLTGEFHGLLTLETNDPDQPTVTVPISGVGIEPPEIEVSPAGLSADLTAGEAEIQEVAIANQGYSPLHVTATLQGTPLPTLEDVRAALEAAQTAITATIPERHDFLGGDFGTSIFSYPSTMYGDRGNYLYVGSESLLSYTNGEIAASALLGPAGRYFTRKFPGLFVFAAELHGLDRFAVGGSLAANGEGYVDGTVLTATIGFDRYRGFVKRVYGTTHPSVNHLVIVQDRPEVSHSFSSLTYFDNHEVVGLEGSSRLYYLLYAGADGRFIDDAETQAIMEAFIAALPSPWLTIAPSSATVEPGAAVALEARFDSATLIAGDYDASIVLTSNDPDEPETVVPAHLHVTGTPAIRVSGDEIVVESEQEYVVGIGLTEHSLALPGVPAGGGELEVLAEGDNKASIVEISAEGLELGAVGMTGNYCAAAQGKFILSSADLAALAADGRVEVRLQNSPGVAPSCVVNRHTVRLRYEETIASLAFGGHFVGNSRTRSVAVHNDGTAVLEVGPIESDSIAFLPSPATLDVPPGGSAVLDLTFAPDQPGPRSGVVTLHSNDPAWPAIAIALSGEGIAPPIAGVSPLALTATLPPGHEEIQTFSITNTGGSPLEFDIEVAADPGIPCGPAPVYVTNSNDGSLLAVDRETGAATTVVTGLYGGGSVALDEAKGVAYVATYERLVEVNLASARTRRVARVDYDISGIVLSRDRRTAYLASSFSAPYSVTAVDLATGAKEYIGSGIPGAAGIATPGDGSALFVVDYGGDLHRLDPATGAVEIVASGLGEPNALALSVDGTTAYVGGWPDPILAVDVGTGAREALPYSFSYPAGIATDRIDGSLWVIDYAEDPLYRIDLELGEVSIVATGFSGAHKGIAPASGTECRPPFLTAPVGSGVVAPGESAEVQARFDAAGLVSGLYPGAIRVTTNDPVTPLLEIPVLLTVSGGLPELVLFGEEVLLESSQVSFPSGSTLHAFDLSTAPAGDAVLEVTAEGNLPDAGPAVTVDGFALGQVAGSGLTCGPAWDTFAIDATTFAARAGDGRLEVGITNPVALAYCEPARHTVRLRYNGPLDPLDFGTVFLGRSREFRVVARNTGVETLVIGSIRTDRPEFTVADPSATLAPGESRVIEVGFHPSSEGPVEARLTLESNDPDRPHASIALFGNGREIPRIEVDPLALSAMLPAGGTETQNLTIRNTGAGELHVALDLASLPGGPLPAAGPAELLPSSPVPVTGLVADPANGALYAHAYSGTAFYRYDAARRTWNRLADAPTSGAAPLGAARLQRRVYTIDGSRQTLGVYDLDSGTWDVLPNPLPNAANLASDGDRYLYLMAGRALARFDPATLAVQPLAAAPITYYLAVQGLQWFEGSLYGQTNTGGGFLRYQIASGMWETLSSSWSAPEGAAIDPANRTFSVVWRNQGTDVLSRYTLDHPGATHTPVPLSIAGGGLAWLPDPTPGFFIPQGGAGTGFVYLATPSQLAVLDPLSATLEPGGEVAVQVQIEAGPRPPGDYAARISIHSDDPDRPLVEVPLSLTVVPAPDIDVLGSLTTVESEQAVTSTGQLTLHHLPVSAPTSGLSSLEVTVMGESEEYWYQAEVIVEGELRATVRLGEGQYRPCGLESARIDLSPEEILAFAADGDVDVVVANSIDMRARCGYDRHTVKLDYTVAIDPLDFGMVLVGDSRSLAFRVRNVGTATLNVSAIHVDHPAFSLSPLELQLAPGESREVGVTYRPTSPGPGDAVLVLSSDDPDEPAREVRLAGVAAGPPIVAVAPSALSAALISGQQETRTLEIRNLGGSPLVAGVAARFGLEDPLELEGIDPAPLAAGEAGTFEDLASSPEPVGCVVEDLAGGLYAVSTSSPAFYRYDASSDTWHQLASAPSACGYDGGGAALLGGKVYVAYGGFSSSGSNTQVGVYDIATDSWSTFENPIRPGAGIVASDGERYLYFALGQELKRLDPASGELVPLAVPPAYLFTRGGMRHIEGALYAHNEGPYRTFLRYDIAEDYWAHLPLLPGSAVAGATIDRSGRQYVAVAQSASDLYRYSIDEATWTTTTVPFLHGSRGGLGWLPGPVPGIYLAQGTGVGFGRLVTATAFLAVAPATVTVPPGESREVAVRFDATSLAGGEYRGALEVRSNDPEVPVWVVATSLEVTGAPRLAVTGERVSLDSTRPVGGGQASSVHRFPITALPAGNLSLELVLNGDAGTYYTSTDLRMEGRLLGRVNPSTGECRVSRRTLTVAAADVAQAAADGYVDFTVSTYFPSGYGASVCHASEHGIRIQHTRPGPPLAFGAVPSGGVAERGFTIRNTGTSALHVSRITPTVPELEVSRGAATLQVGESLDVRLSFRPIVGGDVEAAVEIESDDPVTSIFSFAVTGSGVAAPRLEVEPGAISAVLRPDGRTTRAITLRNTGGLPLAFSLNRLSAAAGAVPGELCPPETAYLADHGGWRIVRGDLRAGTSTVLAGLPSPRSLALSRDRRTLYAVTDGPGLVTVDVATGETRVVSPVLPDAYGMRLAPDGRSAYVLDWAGGAMLSIDLATGIPTIVVSGLGIPIVFDLSPGGDIAYVTLAGGGIARVDLRTGAYMSITEDTAESYGIAVDEAAGVAYVTEYWPGRVLRVDLATGAVSPLATGLRHAGAVALDASRTTLFVAHGGAGTTDGGITAIDLETGSTQFLMTGIHSALGLALVPSGPCAGEFAAVAPAVGIVPAGGAVTVELALDAAGLPVGRYPATFRITSDDPARPVVDLPVTLDVSLNLPPQAVMLAPALSECDRAGAGAVLLDGSMSQDPDSTPGTSDDIAQYDWFEDLGLPTERLLGSGPTLGTVLALGAHAVSLRLTDVAGESDTTSAVLAVEDTQPPSLVLAVTPAELWPAEHQLEPVAVAWVVADLCDPDPAVALVGVVSSEPDDAAGVGDGATTGDIASAQAGIPDHDLELRAERGGAGPGRTYELTYRATDGSGNGVSALGVVQVPHDPGQGRGGTILKVEATADGYRWYWSPVPEATGFDLVSGALEQVARRPNEVSLGWFEVLSREGAETWLEDPAVRAPAPGRCFFYVVEGRTERGGWGYGEEPLPWPRVPEGCEGGCP